MLELKNLEIQRGDFHLGPLNYEFDSDQIHLILGENGSGKTSLLKTIVGRLKPKAGTSLCDKAMAALGSEPFLFENWQAREFYQWYRNLAGFQPDSDMEAFFEERYFKQIFEQKISHLSSGRKRAFELFCVLSLDCSVYLLDEVFSHLDQKRRSFFAQALDQKNQNKQVMIILAGHSQEDFDLIQSKKKVLQLK